jgi:hypothetical protein
MTKRRGARSILAILGAALALALLAGCGDDGGVEAEEAPTTTQAPPEDDQPEDDADQDDDSDQDSNDDDSDDDSDQDDSNDDDSDDDDSGSDDDADTFATPDDEDEAISEGSQTISGYLSSGQTIDYDISIPDGVTAEVTVTPLDDIDVVVDTLTETIDDGLSGDSEYLEGEGPIEETISVSEYYGYSGAFEITLTYV